VRRFLARYPGRRSSWLLIGAWLVLVVVFAPFGAKIPDITNDEYVLPGKSQTARLHEIIRTRFPGGDQRPAIIVYRHVHGLTQADKNEIAANAQELAKID
jgi:RND superfamily putative drug exporter